MVCISTGSDCLLWAINVGISHGLSFMDNNDWYSSFFFLSWTIMFGIATGFVCLGQELSVYHSLSWTIWVIYSRLCLSWAI